MSPGTSDSTMRALDMPVCPQGEPVPSASHLQGELMGAIPTTQETADALMALLTTGPDGAPL